MRVLFVGRKRNAGANRNVCQTDVMLLSDIEHDDVIAIVSTGRHRFCYDLDALATWFLQDPVARATLPTLPESRAAVPATVYKRIVREAHMRVPGFREHVRSKTAGMSPAQRKFVLTGVQSRRRTGGNSSSMGDLLSLDDLAQLLLAPTDDEEEDLAAMLPDADDLERLIEDISNDDTHELDLSLRESRRSPRRRR